MLACPKCKSAVQDLGEHVHPRYWCGRDCGGFHLNELRIDDPTIAHSGKYTVEVEPPYIRIGHRDYPGYLYQLKLEDEGLVLDVLQTINGETNIFGLFHTTNEEAFENE